jgi:hypothetical protein
MLSVRGIATLASLGGAVVIALFAATSVDAHKGITSRFTYNDDVYPIFRDKCARCHSEGGPTPMSLLRYDVETGGAKAWAESIREMLVSEAMPPWFVDSTGPAVRNNHSLTPRELDILVTWAVGGTPHGDLNKNTPDLPFSAQWSLGKPDLEIPMEKPYELGPGTMNQTADIILPTNFTEAKWVRAVDLMPGAPTMVRQATISVENGPVLAVWEPGDDAPAAPSGAGFKLAPGAKLKLTIRYKKPWQDEQTTKTDRSTLGLYFTDEPMSGKSIEALTLDGPAEEPSPAPRTFGGEMKSAGRVLAVRPLVDQPYTSMTIEAVAASGRRVPLLKLRGIRAEWPRRYWLADPVELPAGTKIEVKATPGDPDSGPLTAKVNSPLQVALDYVPQ